MILISLLLLSQLILTSPAPEPGSGSWLLTWTAVTYEPGICTHPLLLDPYTGKSGYSGGCLLAHFQIVERKMERRFPTKKEAWKFMNGAPKAPGVLLDYCKDFKIKRSPEKGKLKVEK